MRKRNFLLGICALAGAFAQGAEKFAANSEEVREQLTSPYFEKLYARTYWSLLDRQQKDGFLPESLTGAYPGMFPRTIGAYVLLLLETGREQRAEEALDCVLKAMRQNEMDRVPRIIARKGDGYEIRDDDCQVDAQAHLILGWARLALKRGRTPFEDRTWDQVSRLLSDATDRQYFDHTAKSKPGLIRNNTLEHSREGRSWDTWDLLTQSFMGGALKDMAVIARRRGDTKRAELWEKRLGILERGILENLTIERGGRRTYLEMRLPDSNKGVPYLGLGWVSLSPVAAGWQPKDAGELMKNTVDAQRKAFLKTTHGLPWMPTDGYPDGSFSDEIIGKGQGWEMDFSRQQGDYERVVQILQLIEVANSGAPIYMEGAWLESPAIKPFQRLHDSDLPELEKAVWKTKDAGNGEQTSWWCWAMARLRGELGLPVEPARP